jgi:hypothetical protein
LRVLLQLLACNSKVVVCRCTTGLQFNGSCITGSGLLQQTEPLLGNSQVGIRHCILRINCNCLANPSDCRLVVPRLCSDSPKQVQGVKVLWLCLQHGFIKIFCVNQFALLVQCKGLGKYFFGFEGGRTALHGRFGSRFSHRLRGREGHALILYFCGNPQGRCKRFATPPAGRLHIAPVLPTHLKQRVCNLA